MDTIHNAIHLGERYKLLAVWQLHSNNRWELIEITRPARAIYLGRCCSQLFVFPTNFRPSGVYRRKNDESMNKAPKAVSASFSL